MVGTALESPAGLRRSGAALERLDLYLGADSKLARAEPTSAGGQAAADKPAPHSPPTDLSALERWQRGPDDWEPVHPLRTS